MCTTLYPCVLVRVALEAKLEPDFLSGLELILS